MKLATFNENRLGVVIGDEIVDITTVAGIDPASWPPTGMVGLIGAFERLKPAIEAGIGTLPRLPLSKARLQCPLVWPNKIIAFHANFDFQVGEKKPGAAAVPVEEPAFFMKSPSTLVGPNDTIELPDLPGREIIYECELGIIIGKGGREISRAAALDHIFGYSCLVDMVVRGKEERTIRKAFDTFCPLGPWIVTADEVPDPHDLDMQLSINGELRQKTKLTELLLDIPGMIEMASSIMTLQPGDIIASGTPPGVAPMAGGEKLHIAISRIGEMTLDVVQTRTGRHSFWG